MISCEASCVSESMLPAHTVGTTAKAKLWVDGKGMGPANLVSGRSEVKWYAPKLPQVLKPKSLMLTVGGR